MRIRVWSRSINYRSFLHFIFYFYFIRYFAHGQVHPILIKKLQSQHFQQKYHRVEDQPCLFPRLPVNYQSFRENYKTNPRDKNIKFDDNIYRTLQWYEQHVDTYARSELAPVEALSEEEAAQFKLLSAHPEHCKELAEIIDHKVDNERREQEDFL